MLIVARRVSSPKGFVLPAEGFRPAARVLPQSAAAGLKPAATMTKAACAACRTTVQHTPAVHISGVIEIHKAVATEKRTMGRIW